MVEPQLEKGQHLVSQAEMLLLAQRKVVMPI